MVVELGLDTFGDISQNPDGTLRRADEVLRDVVEGVALYGEKVMPMVRDMLSTDHRH